MQIHPYRNFLPSIIVARLTVIITFLISLFNTVTAQQPYDLPTVIKPSPQSQAITRYGDYPMSDYTGLTDISIPLHTVTGRKLSLPISMSFHASGRMANETNGPLGIRWTLNCGGVVTRTMKGVPDEWNRLTSFDPGTAASNYLQNGNEPSFDVLYSACPEGKESGAYGNSLGLYDSEYDIFNYALPNGKQGHFILKNQNGVKVPMTIPYEPLKIVVINSPSDKGYTDRIEITDADGTKYIFGRYDTPSGNAVEYTDVPDIAAGMLASVPTAWYLTQIVSSDGTDEISLSYTLRTTNLYTASESARIGDQMRDNSTDLRGNEGDPFEDNLRSQYVQLYHEQDANPVSAINSYTTPTLSGIQFNGGSVSLSYTGSTSFNTLLSGISVNRGTTLYKKISFSLSIHSGESDIYYLDGLSFYGEGQSVATGNYSFSYYEPGYTYQMQGSYSDAQNKDWWGYYRLTNHLLPYQSIAYTPVPYGNSVPVYWDIGYGRPERDGVENSKKVGMLQTITYPTGGQTEFVYESNQYDMNQIPYYQPGPVSALSDGPGLRIKEVLSKPIGGKDIHKIYKYGVYEDGRGFINELLRPGSTSFQGLTESQSNIMYFWTEANNTWVTDQAGFRIRNYYSDPNISFDFSGSGIKYDAVTEYYIQDGVPQQKTQTHYSWDNNEQVSDFIIHDNGDLSYHYPRKFSDPQNAWKTPVMTGKTLYTYSNSQFTPVKSESYTYNAELRDEAWDMPTYQHTQIVFAETGVNDVAQQTYNTAKGYTSCSVYGFGFRRYTTGMQQLLTTTTQDFTPAGTVTTVKNTTYEPTYNFVQSEEITNSKNETIKTSYAYPLDFVSQQPYTDMVNTKHILSPVIQKTVSKSGSFLESVTTNYKDWGNNITAPVTVVTQKGNSPDTRVHFYGYDAFGNVLSVAKENGVMHSYAWGYNGRYPVAEVTGGTATTASGSVPQYTLDNATGDGDDATVRNALAPLLNIPNTVATTYTFKPLVGMTSQTDAAGRITYYEYDPMGRLSLVRDQDNNILKRYCYSYYNQTGACPDGPPAGATVFSSEDQSDYYYSNTCTSPAQPDPVYVTVTAGQFLSTVSVADANQQARQYGQNYANQHGTCIVPPFTLTFNNTTGGTFDVNLTEVNTNQTYSVFVPQDGTTLQLPEGTYEVQIAPDVPPSSYYQFYYQVGCDYYSSSTWSIEFDNVPLNGNCNTITIN